MNQLQSASMSLPQDFFFYSQNRVRSAVIKKTAYMILLLCIFFGFFLGVLNVFIIFFFLL